MSDKKQAKDHLHVLRERAKELDCLYKVEELLASETRPLPNILRDIIATIPCGWQYPEFCQAKIVCEDAVYEPPNYVQTLWKDTAPIRVEDRTVGFVEVSYVKEMPSSSEGLFLEKESKLIHTIADRIGQTVFHRKLGNLLLEREAANRVLAAKSNHEWMVIVDLLRRTDEKLYLYTSRKMLHHLFRSGVQESRKVLNMFGADFAANYAEGATDVNTPSQKQSRESIFAASDQVFAIAARHLNDEEILSCLHKWIQENKLSFLIKTVDTSNAPLGAVIDAILRYRALPANEAILAPSTEEWLKVSLIRRFFSDNSSFINVAKRHLKVADFFDLATHIIYPSVSNGRLGGKSTGLFLSRHVLLRASDNERLFTEIKTPKTWYMTADCMTDFLRYNNLEDVNQQKYNDLEQIRIEYPNIIQLFKHARFPDDISKGLSLALDDIGERSIIVRSSSLLEDRAGTAFSGKYKSLFLSNQGSKQSRLEALSDAIAEIYASVFGPDPILYRSEHGLTDFHEEMGIMIQEVVGTRVGPYLMPTFAGVAFSSNEFRWSPRLKRDDGLVRLVPGLGTRAVDRISNDYPVLLSPGHPALRVNVSPDEIRYYSPSQIDVINLDTQCFETIPLKRLLNEHGNEIPNLHQLVSVYKEGNICQASAMELDVHRDELVVTFDGLINRTNFVKQVRAILLALQEGLGTPVDIEFASDGKSFYLLQCRSQYTESDVSTSAIPQDIPVGKILFTANRFISNGRVPDITHIVYVSPQRYAEQTNMDALVDIGRAVGRLNALLPKRRFILMGPGRWGSRGDIKQGVQVTYSDISNTSVLIEIALKKGSYSPEPSFGTHFFQDMVEARIRYIPLYPDDQAVVFNEQFLSSSYNMMPAILPEYAHLADVVHVIDVPSCKNDNVLKILMNADIGQAVGFFGEPAAVSDKPIAKVPTTESRSEDFWRWRHRMAEQLALRLRPERFGVQAIYLIGSTANSTAGPGSDIDLLVHFNGSPVQKQELLLWLEGWSLSLAEQNYLRTGYMTEGLLDVHLVTDSDIKNRTSYAVKIDAITDPALPLPMMESAQS
ncbi:MAG: pyruvate, phosphate dikinase [Planctomycetes bacterium RBG_13_46_10]|nr:MAG: pyruvate, phosphate dikinase [Planctomycetes bacterium RBG_13_46_10]